MSLMFRKTVSASIDPKAVLTRGVNSVIRRTVWPAREFLTRSSSPSAPSGSD